jgi:hypothetical protein
MTSQRQAAPRAAGSTAPQGLTIWEPATIKWEFDRPQGCKLTLLEGDWSTPGVPFTYAFFMPDGVWFPPHVHPSDARVTVVKGTLLLGHGTKLDKTAARTIELGSTAFVPADLPHFEGSKGETIIIGSAVPPWGTTFLEG